MDVQVSGDPALLIPAPEVTPEEGLIGVNLGFGDDLWGHDPEVLVSEIGSAVRTLAAQGYRFTGILMHADDRDLTERALNGVPARIVQPSNAIAAAAELARCSVVVVSRLHAGILAAVSQTPVVSLEYQPKCRDFALSVDDERSLIRTDQLTSSAVVERVHAAIADTPAIKGKVLGAVTELRKRLSADYAGVRSQLGVPSSPLG
jgi:polysaccharide pyruvyl transferase WcaK-like protein